MKSDLNRRDFAKLSAAAFGGMLAGTVGCGKGDKPPADKPTGDGESLLMKEPHVCRGLNACKGHGSCKTAANDCKGKNACAGQGKCATAKAHECRGMNVCKGQGGCGEKPGENACSEKGACSVPLADDKWAKARAHFEAAMKKAGKNVGSAPEAASA